MVAKGNSKKKGSTRKRTRSLKNSTYKQIKKRMPSFPAYADTDGDGIINRNDCRPLDPKRQGRFHDLALSRLASQEKKLEAERRRLMTRLEAKKEIMTRKLKSNSKVVNVKRAVLKQKQAIINEINKEKDAIRKLKIANRTAKRELFSNSPLGKAKRISQTSLIKTRNFLTDPKTKRKIKNFNKTIDEIWVALGY